MIASNVKIERGCTISENAIIGYSEHGGKILIRSGCRINHNVLIRSCTGIIKIGLGVVISYGCILHGLGGITIGNNVILSPNCQLYAQNHGIAKNGLIKEQKSSGKGITIGSDVWLGANVIVVDGVTIGKGVVVGAGGVVTKNIPTYEIWAGNPAKKIGDRK